MEKRVTKRQYNEAIQIIKAYRKQLLKEVSDVDTLLSPEDTKPILDYEMTSRLRNCIIKNCGSDREMSLKEFSETYTKQRIACFRNAGKQTIQQLEKLLADHGLKMR